MTEDRFADQMILGKVAAEGYLIVELVTEFRELGTWKWEVASAAMRLEQEQKVLLEPVPRGARLTLITDADKQRLADEKIKALQRMLEPSPSQVFDVLCKLKAEAMVKTVEPKLSSEFVFSELAVVDPEAHK